MSAHSWPGQGPSISCGALDSMSNPSASARRRAGSIVTTHARRPLRAASSANAAETVVFPTPPEPQQITTDLFSTKSFSSEGAPLGVLAFCEFGEGTSGGLCDVPEVCST